MAARLFVVVLGAATLALIALVVSRWPQAQPTPVAAQPTAEARPLARGIPVSIDRVPAPAPEPPEPLVAVQPRPSSATVIPASVPVAPAPRAPQAAVPAAPATALTSADVERTHAQVMAAIAARERQHAAGALNIEMYSTSWCGACKAARLYMQDHGIAFTDHDIEADPDARTTQLSLNPGGSVPTIDVDGREVLVGFSGDDLDAAMARATAARSGS
jgi:glutaredoxin